MDDGPVVGQESGSARRRPTERYLSTHEVAAMFAVKAKTVRAWIESGEIRALKLHRQWRVPEAETRRILRECRRGV